jgi:hypothetical protein
MPQRVKYWSGNDVFLCISKAIHFVNNISIREVNSIINSPSNEILKKLLHVTIGGKYCPRITLFLSYISSMISKSNLHIIELWTIVMIYFIKWTSCFTQSIFLFKKKEPIDSNKFVFLRYTHIFSCYRWWWSFWW